MEMSMNIKASSSNLKADVKEFVPKSAQLLSPTSPINALEGLDTSNLTYLEDNTSNLYVHHDPGPYSAQQSFEYLGGITGLSTHHPDYFDFPTSNPSPTWDPNVPPSPSWDPNVNPSPTWPLECDKRPGSKEELYSLFPTESKKKNRKKKMTDPRQKDGDVPKPDTSKVWTAEPRVKIWSRQDKLPMNEINVASMNWPGLKPKSETDDKEDSEACEGVVKKTFAELVKKSPSPQPAVEQPLKSDVELKRPGKYLPRKEPPASKIHDIKVMHGKLPDRSPRSTENKNWRNAQPDEPGYGPGRFRENKNWRNAAKFNDEKAASQPALQPKQPSYKSADLGEKTEMELKGKLQKEFHHKSGVPTHKVFGPHLTRHEGQDSNLPEQGSEGGATMSWSSVVSKKADKYDTAKQLNAVEGEDIQDEVKLSSAVGEEKKELTEEERELLRIKRRERRKREKETKKKLKEDEQRKKIYEPKTSKIQFISSDILQKVNERPKMEVRYEQQKGIKFMDEEYPDLSTGRKKRDKSPKPKVVWREARDGEGKLVSDAESNSEWETEDESRHSGYDTGAENEPKPQSDLDFSVPELQEAGPELLSYSSILKAKSVPKENAKKTTVPKEGAIKTTIDDKKVENKKVKKKDPKKKDPIAFDLFSAFTATVKKQKEQSKKVVLNPRFIPKSTPVLGGKLKLGTTVRNQLDSSAPARRRGKEREGGKKKKPTKMKKIILADREKRKLARKEAEDRRTERIEAGITLKPLVPKDFAETGDKDNFTKTVYEENTIHQERQNNLVEKVGLGNPICEEYYIGNKVEKKSVKEKEIAPNDSLPNNTLDVQNEEVVEKNEDPADDLEAKAKSAIHSRKFRDYCNNDVSAELGKAVSNLMIDLVRFQDKQHEKDPVKAKVRRRYVVGLREVKKFMKVKKIHCLVLAPDIEKVASEKGLDDFVSDLLALAKENSIDVIFALNRRKLGQLCKKKVPVSCIGIMNHQGSESNFNLMQELAANLRITYSEKLSLAMANLDQDGNGVCYNNNEIVPSLKEFSFTPQFNDAFDPRVVGQSYTSEQFGTEYYSYSHSEFDAGPEYHSYSHTDFGDGQNMYHSSANDTGYQMSNQAYDETQQVGRNLLDILRN